MASWSVSHQLVGNLWDAGSPLIGTSVAQVDSHMPLTTPVKIRPPNAVRDANIVCHSLEAVFCYFYEQQANLLKFGVESGEDIAHVVKCMPSMHEVLGSNPTTFSKNK